MVQKKHGGKWSDAGPRFTERMSRRFADRLFAKFGEWEQRAEPVEDEHGAETGAFQISVPQPRNDRALQISTVDNEITVGIGMWHPPWFWEGGDLGANDPLEDLLVAAADKVWKGKREEALEQALVHRIAVLSGTEAWQVWLRLDDILTALAEAASERLGWQARHRV